MKYNKKYKRGLFLLFFLLLLIGSISFIKINPKSNKLSEKLVSLSAPEDGYEENDDPSTAYDIRLLEANWLSSLGGNGTQLDDDWYMIDLDPGEERLKVILIFNDSAGNIGIEIYDWNFNYVDGNDSIDDNEYFERDIYPDEIYYLRVYGDNAGNTYDLWWEDLVPYDDDMEENDDFGNTWWVNDKYYPKLKIVNLDEDWFSIYLNSGETIDVGIYFYHMDGDLQLDLYDPSNTFRLGSHTSDDHEFVSFIADMSGDWRIRVYHEYGNSTVPYSLDVFTGDDWMEENDDYWNPWYVSPNYYYDLVILNGDEDWFQVWLEAGDTIDVRMYFDQMVGDLQLELYDPNDSYNPRVGSYSSDNDEFIYFTVDVSGYWRIRVYHENGNSYVHYDMDLWHYMGDDWMEENDDYGNAHWVDAKYYSDLRILDYDEDWFQLSLNIGDAIDISIYFNHNDGNLSLELYDPSNSWRVGSYSTYDDEFISYSIDKAGIWRIRVYHEYGNSTVPYELDISYYPGDDWMEENDDYENAHWVDAKYYPDLMIKGDDEDWFRTYLNDGDIIDIRIYFDSYQGDLQLEVYDPNGYNIVREVSYSNYDQKSISFTADNPGEYRILVYQPYDGYDIRYHLEIQINGIIGGDDPYEFNNHFEVAYDLRDYERRWLSNIHGLAVQEDEDWYMIDVTPGFQHLLVNFKFNSSLGFLQVDLYRMIDEYNIDWDAVWTNYSMTGDKKIDINCSYIDPGIYMILVRGDFTGLEYDLWWDDLRTDFRTDDNYEENDNAMFAYDLSFHQYQNLWTINGTAIQRDNDWYKIQVDPGFEHLFVELTYDYQEGALGIEIYNMYGSEVIDNWTKHDNEIISYDLPSNGTYYIRITGSYTGNIYSLRWETWETYTEEMIPGYDIFILIAALFGVVMLFTLKWKKNNKYL